MFGCGGFATGMPVMDAQDDFRRAKRRHLLARAAGWVVGRRSRYPRALSDPAALPAGRAELKVIPVCSIVGTVDPTLHFDDRFRPASEKVRRRWERIALAHRSGAALPPITVLQRPDGYYVVDGRHRVSVARALGHRDIDAWMRRVVTPVDQIAA